MFLYVRRQKNAFCIRAYFNYRVYRKISEIAIKEDDHKRNQMKFILPQK